MPTILHISKRHAGVVGLSRAENFDPSNVSPAMQDAYFTAEVVEELEDIVFVTETDPEIEGDEMYIWRYRPDSPTQFTTSGDVTQIPLSYVKDKDGNPATVE